MGYILLSKASRTLSLPSKKLYKFLKTSFFPLFYLDPVVLIFFLQFMISTNKLAWSSSASFKVILPL